MRTGAMRLVQFQTGSDGPRIGLEERDGGNVIDLNAFDPSLPRRMREFLEVGDAALAIARRAQESGQHILPRAQVNLLAPIPNPGKVICVGLNYADHCLEQNVKIPEEPIIFSKFPSSVTGPYDEIIHPAEIDWEVELAFVIGKKGTHIKESAAMDHIVGFMVANDVTARDWQMKRNGMQWILGKSFDTFCPLGPAIVTKDCVPGTRPALRSLPPAGLWLAQGGLGCLHRCSHAAVAYGVMHELPSSLISPTCSIAAVILPWAHKTAQGPPLVGLALYLHRSPLNPRALPGLGQVA
uniref:Fumarylacetoacetate hydrolase domain containing 2A n=1 Tax=Chelonoidis abingdonii TaxID=106734 RepID=A0A8C0IU38_CHEAB